MKAVISKSDLVSLVGKIQSIVSAKPAIPILSNVLIEALDDQLIISATDLTVSMRAFVDAKIIEEGATTLPARRFFQLIREITSPQIKITTQTNEIAEITAGSSTFKIHGMHKNEFPALPDLNGAPQFSIPSSQFREMLFRSSFAAAREDSRYVLNGILLKIENQVAHFTGTDGKRLAKTHTSVDLDPSFQGTYIFPLKAVEEMTKMLGEDDSQSSLTLMHDKVCLEAGNLTLMTKLLSGQFPDVERVIPQDPKISFRLHREELMSLLRQVSLFTTDTSSSVKFTFETGALHLLAESSEIGEGSVNMPVDYSGETFTVAFNPYYFLDILRHSQDETVVFSIEDPYNPGLITDSTSSLFVIMPMRLPVSSTANDAPEKPALT